MALIIKYDDIASLLSASSSQFSGWSENLGDVKNNFEVFVNMESFSGMTATSLKSYITDVNQTVIKSLQEIFSDFETRFLLYREGFFTDVDDDLHTIITEDEMKTCKTSIEQGYGDFLDTLALINTQVNNISDLVSGMPNEAAIKLGYSLSSKSITTILQQAEAHEDYHLKNDFSNIENLISSLTTFCNEMLAQTNKEMKTYQPGDIYGYSSHQALTADYINSGARRQELVFASAKARENESVRQGLLINEALAQGRTEQGWVSFVSYSLLAIGGVACIVFSAGAATPLVVALSAISGVATTSYAVSNMVQAGYDIYLGQAGDATTVAFNPLRDTVFWGNQTAYDIFGFAAVTSSMVFTAGISAYNIYQAGGAQAAQIFVGKTIISAGNGYIGGLAGQQTALYFGASPAQAQLAGLASGAFFSGATAIGLNKLDTYYNWSGTNQPVFTAEKTILKNGEIAFKSANGELVRSPEFLDSNGNIKWPKADGFVVDDFGNAVKYNANLQKGQIIDRYGNSNGRFTSPVNENIMDYESRGLPYPESSKPYIQYNIKENINIQNVQKSYDNLSPYLKTELNEAMINYGFTLNDIANPQAGKISTVFNGGGGTQIELGTSVYWYEKLGLIEVVK